MPAELHQNDIGTQFTFTLKDQNDSIVDISTAGVIKIIFKKPSCTILERNASLLNDGTDGVFYYITQTGDLDEIGTYNIQGYVEIDANSWHTDIFAEKVFRNLN